MKTTIDLPDRILQEATRYSGAKTKRDAILIALKEYNRLQRVRELVKMFGTSTSSMTNDEIEALENDRI